MEVFEGTGASTRYGARADSLSKDSLAGSIEALVEEFDRLRLAATDVVGAFDGLIADVAHQANAVVSTTSATPAVVSQPGDLSASGDDLLTAESDRLDLNEQTLELIKKRTMRSKIRPISKRRLSRIRKPMVWLLHRYAGRRWGSVLQGAWGRRSRIWRSLEHSRQRLHRHGSGHRP